jgi:hypothetical protein
MTGLPQTLSDSEGKQFVAGAVLCTRKEPSTCRILCTKIAFGVGTFKDGDGRVFTLDRRSVSVVPEKGPCMEEFPVKRKVNW